MSAGEPLLQLIDVTRSFPGVTALDQVNFELNRGEVHALVGENGAGKSTLINILSGVLRPDHGRVVLEGQDIELHDPVTARAQGIITVHQEADLFASLSVAENMALTQGLPVRPCGFIRWSQVYAEAQAAVASLGETIDIRRPAAHLSVAHRQMTQIAAAVQQRARVVVLDEPTSALTSVETEWLFEQIAQLKAAGVGIIYISHRQEEIFQLSDRITVLRDGQRVFSGPTTSIDRDGLIEAMVGRKPSATATTREKRLPSKPDTTPRLKLSQLTDEGGRFTDIDLSVQPGEIVGLYGLVGAGRSELAKAVFGLEPTSVGTIEVDGQQVRIRTVNDAVARSIAYVPEDRLREGVCRGLSVRENMVLSSLQQWTTGPLASQGKEKDAAESQVTALGIKLRSVEQPIAQLSGGNQQKVVLARWLLTEPRVLILDEPTRGVDVGAKAEIHQLVRRLANAGCGVLMISSDLPEVLEHSDRIIVLRNGRVSAQFDPRQTTANEIAAAALPEEAPDRDQASSRRGITSRWRRLLGSEVGLVAAIGALSLCLTLSTDQFLTASNFVGILTSAAVWIVLAMAAAVVIIAGGIDISIGALLALSAAAAGVVLQQEIDPRLAIPLAALVAMAVGTIGGSINSAVALLGRIHPIVVTLGTMTIYRGLLITLTGGRAIGDLPPQFVRLFSTSIFGVPLGAVMAILVAVAMHFFLVWTRSGRHLYAYGASPSAAKLVGISQRAAWMTAFGVGGLLTGIAGLFELAKIGSMQSTLGTGYELRAIAAAVIGGTAITGGRGSVFGVVLGALLLSLLYNALVLWNVSGFHYQLVVGMLILVAVLLDLWWRRSEA